jgi:hypothetical protein
VGARSGSLNRVQKDTRERFRAMAQELEPVILQVATTGNVVAIKEIFDRAYGKPPQPLTDADGEGPPVIKIIKYDGD